jgi:Helix-turn-helix domain
VAAARLELSVRQVERLCRALRTEGPSGLVSRRRGRPSNRQLAASVQTGVVALVREHYADFGPTLALEKLVAQHDIAISVEMLRTWMRTAGLWVPRAQRPPRAHQPRHRRACRGELVQIDGSDHEWFEDRGPRSTLLVYVDDATSELMALRCGPSESARTVHLDGCVQVEGAYYGAPPGHVGQVLLVQWDGQTVRLLDPRTGQLLREHRWQARDHHRIARADRPARTLPETAQLLARTARAGPAIGTLCTAIQQQDGPVGVRRILGVLALAKRYGVPTVEAACHTALECGVATYRFVRRYCERHPTGLLTLRQIDPLIRQLTLYRDLIDRATDQEIPNAHRTRPRPAPAPPLRHGRRPGSPAPPSPSRANGPARPRRHARHR